MVDCQEVNLAPFFPERKCNLTPVSDPGFGGAIASYGSGDVRLYGTTIASNLARTAHNIAVGGGRDLRQWFRMNGTRKAHATLHSACVMFAHAAVSFVLAGDLFALSNVPSLAQMCAAPFAIGVKGDGANGDEELCVSNEQFRRPLLPLLPAGSARTSCRFRDPAAVWVRPLIEFEDVVMNAGRNTHERLAY